MMRSLLVCDCLFPKFLMPTTPTGKKISQKPQAFEIKSADLPLVALVLKTSDMQALEQELLSQFGPLGSSSDFFNDDALLIDCAQLDPNSPLPDLPRLLAVLRQCKLVAVAIRHAAAATVSEALALGLVQAQEIYVAAPSMSVPPPAPAPAKQVDIPVALPVPTLVIDKPVRSGQKVYARGGDLIILSMVNRGAEVVADGNIHVYAALRGKAMAGAKGNTTARIFALAMEAELVSVAGVYRTTEKPFGSDILGKAAQVRLSDDGQEKLLIEPFKL